jgi:hypothetical protein
MFSNLTLLNEKARHPPVIVKKKMKERRGGVSPYIHYAIRHKTRQFNLGLKLISFSIAIRKKNVVPL